MTKKFKTKRNAAKSTRRGFLLKGSVALGGLASVRPESLYAASGAGVRRFGLGTVTYNLARDWDLTQLLARCQETGFEGVELRSTHKHGVEPDINSNQRREVRRLFQKSPVRLVCLGSACEFHSPNSQEVRENIELAKRFVELAADVGAKGVKVRPNGLPEQVPVEVTLKQIGESLTQVARSAEGSSVGIWVEVHGKGTSDPAVMKKIMDYCGHPLVGITWNCNEADLIDNKIQPNFELLRPHIRNVHIHELYDDYPYLELFRLLRESGYEGYTLAEIPEVTGDPVRFMHYYRAIWEQLSS